MVKTTPEECYPGDLLGLEPRGLQENSIYGSCELSYKANHDETDSQICVTPELPVSGHRRRAVGRDGNVPIHPFAVPSITTTLSQIGQFWSRNRFAERKTTKLSAHAPYSHEEVLKPHFL